MTKEALLIITRRLFKNCEDGRVDMISISAMLSSGAVFNDSANIIKEQGEWTRAHANAERMQIAQLGTVLTKLSFRFDNIEKELFKYSYIVKNSSNSNFVIYL